MKNMSSVNCDLTVCGQTAAREKERKQKEASRENRVTDGKGENICCFSSREKAILYIKMCWTAFTLGNGRPGEVQPQIREDVPLVWARPKAPQSCPLQDLQEVIQGQSLPFQVT